MNSSFEQRLMLAALLHDIGKFFQRADYPLFQNGQKHPQNQIDEEAFTFALQICPPEKDSGFGYQHVVWTRQFLNNAKIKNKLLQLPGFTEELLYDIHSPDSLINLACQHHQPSTEFQALVQLADWWSAGVNRTDASTFEKTVNHDHIDWGTDAHKKKPLVSIFDFITNKGEPNNDYPNIHYHGFPLASLSINTESNIFPKAIKTAENGLSQELYRNHWNQFLNEFELLPTDAFDNFFESLLNLLRKYAWCIPSNTHDMAHVSLYEHSRLSAAFAHCFYRHRSLFIDQWEQINSNIFKSFPKEGFYPLLLVGGDVTGIQDFIYNVTSSKAALSLKGRSFFIQLLIESLALRIITHPDIHASNAHIVYASGGKFYIILPNIPKVIEALRSIHVEAELELWENYHGKVGVLLEWVGFALNHFAEGSKFFIDYSDDENYLRETNGQHGLDILWQTLSERLQKAKPRLFKHVIEKTPDSLFEENHPNLIFDNNLGACAITGLPLKKNRNRILERDPNDEFDVIVEEQVAHQIDIGKALKDADYLLSFYGGSDLNKNLRNSIVGKIEILGIKHYLLDKEEIFALSKQGFLSVDKNCYVISINNTDFLDTLANNHAIYGFRFYGGNEQACFVDQNGQPFKEGRHKKAKTLNELTRYKQWEDKTESYLGVLRMDVDSLGDLFINRIPAHMRTFSFYATLSAMLDIFFSGYLNTLRKDTEFKDYVNILYSGGDDLFLVGQWDKIINIAYKIREKFRLFVGRADISISGGIIIVHSNFPIRVAAKLAEEAEHAAKTFNNGQKNSLCLFGETFNLNEEFNYILRWKERFTQVLKTSKSTPQSLLHRLMNYSLRKKAIVDFKPRFPGEKPDYSFKWHSAYSLKRLEDKYVNNKDLKKLLQDLQIELFTKKERNYDLLGVAARWAELELRFDD